MWNQHEETPAVRATGSQPAVAADQKSRTEAQVTAWIGNSVVIKGDVTSAEDLTINGRVEGTIAVGDHNLIVGAGATITAELVAQTITISGIVNGNVTASEKIEIRETGSVDGNIKAPRVAVREGAALRGRIDTLEPAQVADRPPFPVAV